MESSDLPDFFDALIGLTEEQLDQACSNGWLAKDENGNYRLTPKSLEIAKWMTTGS